MSSDLLFSGFAGIGFELMIMLLLILDFTTLLKLGRFGNLIEGGQLPIVYGWAQIRFDVVCLRILYKKRKPIGFLFCKVESCYNTSINCSALNAQLFNGYCIPLTS